MLALADVVISRSGAGTIAELTALGKPAACDDIAKPGLLQPGDPRCLAMLTGITETALRHALPALAGHRDDGRPPLRSTAACQRCAARHGQTVSLSI